MSTYANTLSQRVQQAKGQNLWLLAAISLSLIPHLIRLPLLIVLPSIILLGWRLLFELRYSPLPPRWLRWLLILIALSAIYSTFHTLIGKQAGVGLLVIMLCLKLMEMKSFRDAGVVIGLGFFVIITVFLFDQSPVTGIYMLAVVSLLTTTLIAFSRDQSTTSQWLNWRHSLTIIGQAAPLALLLFVLFPRIPGPLWALPSDNFGAEVGLTDTMSPGKISLLSNNNAVAFRVQFQGPPPAQEKLYWRGPVFALFDGRTWSNPDTALSTPAHRMPSTPLRYHARGEAVHYEVTVEPHQQQWMFALDLLATMPPNSTLSPDYELLANYPVEQLLRYPMSSQLDFFLEVDQPPDPVRYLQLPFDSGPRARQLSQHLRAKASDDTELVQLTLQYIRENSFYYSRQPPLLLKDPIDEFLFETRSGFCEHYASSFVFLMRAAGIPARVVTGYQGGELNPQSDYFIVRQSDAHAWAEVWLPEQGWRRVDPTTLIPADRIENRQDMKRILPEGSLLGEPPNWVKDAWKYLRFSMDRLNHTWNQWVVDYNEHRQQNFVSKLLEKIGLGEFDWTKMVGLLAAGMGMVLVAIGLYTLRPWQRPQRDPIVAAYARFCRQLARHGIQRDPAEGPLDFCQRAQQLRPDIGPAIAHITALYLRLRYAPQARTGEAYLHTQIQELQTAVRRFKA